MSGRPRLSEYMQWARARHGTTRFDLARSGMPALSLSELGATLTDLAIEESAGRGHAPLLQAIAAKDGVDASMVVTAEGTSLANHLVLAAFLDPGDELLVESPGYSPIADTARYLGATVRPFPRRLEREFAIDPAELAAALTPRTRLVALTNLHNPGGAFEPVETLRAVGEIAARAGAHVLVDEVYLDTLPDEGMRRSAALLGEPFVVTSSLTKVYGLSGLRCGYVLAPPAVAERLWELKGLFGVHGAHVAERLAAIALGKCADLRARTHALLAINRPILNRFLERADRLQSRPARFGTVAFPRLRDGSVERLVSVLHDKYETSIVPGRFFGEESHFRIGITSPTPVLQAGLERLESALASLPSR